MVVIALDQAAKTSGYAVFDGGRYKESGTFTIKASLPIGDRLAAFYKSITDLYSRYEDDDVRLVFEDIQMQKGNVITYQRLAYIQAALILWCYYHQIDYDVYSPSHWRKVLGGNFGRKREEQKRHAIELVRQRLGLDVSSDEADAICIGLAALAESPAKEVGFCE